ncbi:SDR family NAD(P)-dependent oxidoreductase [Aliiglaciecola sp. LCG003]|uniref:SDR family NAD(P)-dependent oxidoreductase n=1 Tax=Aliiglaciecola sp. LCG003 TaxID=3053655 RepID=UPI002574038E|nr:SDR family NAD(P)-dependent oxidoreductase [Aliiglaciecola sp. LCG003]WJG10575.1 SDR family NAD(P)-dependent oxidoreductase [Aliiglaciecola sp. LCG003]
MLNDRIILVTGATGDIGQATAIKCAEQGAFLYLAGRNSETLHALSERVGQSAVLSYDVTDERQVKQAFATIMQNSGELHGVVNAAGVMFEAPFAMTRLTDLQQQLNVNTVSAYIHCQLGARLMTRNRRGSLINLCSVVGEQGSAGQSAYATSKAALTGLTRSIAKELGHLGIRVNAVTPGFIDTAMTANYQGDKRQSIINKTMLGRIGNANEVADLICFLLSEQASYITGQVIGVDGGLRL